MKTQPNIIEFYNKVKLLSKRKNQEEIRGIENCLLTSRTQQLAKSYFNKLYT